MAYYPPPESSGGWRTPGAQAARAQAGMDLVRLEAARQWNVRLGVPSAVAIVRHGYLVAEWYEQGAGPSTSFDVYSCSKSYTSTAYGLLFDDVHRGRFAGTPVDLDSPVYAFLPEGHPLTDPRKVRITFSHLLTMTSGIPGESICISGTRTAPGVSPFAAALGLAPFAAKGAQPQAWVDRLAAEPGALWDYSDPAYIHLGLAFHHIAGEELYDFLQRRVLQPIGVEGLAWDMIGLDDGRAGRHTGAHGGVHTTARDMARFGYLMLHLGVWRGAPVVPSWWVKLASQASQLHNPQYGLGWWVNAEGTWPGVPRDTFAAMGWNCNACYVVPSLDLVAVRIGTGPASALDTDPAFIRAILAGVVGE